jgi:GGDEF domain-containing protein
MSNEHEKIEETKKETEKITEKETEKITKEKILEILQKSIEEIMNPTEDIDLKDTDLKKKIEIKKEKILKKIKEITKNFWDKIKEKKDLTEDDIIKIAKIREKFLLEKILEWESIAHIDWLTGLPNLAALKKKFFPLYLEPFKENYIKKKKVFIVKSFAWLWWILMDLKI